jgi:hypothetical protein
MNLFARSAAFRLLEGWAKACTTCIRFKIHVRGRWAMGTFHKASPR